MKSIILHKRFEKSYLKFTKKIKDSFKKRRDLFLENNKDPLLGVHLLHGEYDGFQSFKVTGDIRVIFKEIKKNIFLFLDIGSHSELYE